MLRSDTMRSTAAAFLFLSLSGCLKASDEPSVSPVDTAASDSLVADTGAADSTEAPDQAAPEDNPAPPDEDVATIPDAGAPDAGNACPPVSPDRPPALSEHVGVFDPVKRRFILFGGNPEFAVCPGFAESVYLGDTWAFWVDCGVWEKLPSGPSARGRANAVYDAKDHAMVVFGGRWRASPTSGAYTVYNDVWWLDLTTDTWSEVKATGAKPVGRANASAVWDSDQNRLLVFGGNKSTSGLSYQPLNDTVALDLATDTWEKLAATGMPTARLFAAAAYDSTHKSLVITQGGDENAFSGPFLGDSWSLDLGTLKWKKLPSGGASPDHRIWGTAAYSKAFDQVILFGGHDDGALGNRNDVWTLDAAGAWDVFQENDTFNKGPAGQCDFPPDFSNVALDAPERRSGHALAWSEEENALYVHGGKSDCGLVDDVWRLDMDDGKWTALQPASIGESCLRFSDSCIDLCTGQ